MNALEEFKSRYRQYQVHKALLSIDEINYYSQEIERQALSADECAFLDASKAACGEDDALEASEELNAQLQEAKHTLERQRDELQSAYDRMESQKQNLEQRNVELTDIKERLETAKQQVDVNYDRAVEKLRVQEQMNLLGERMRGQHNILSRQNWMGSFVVIGTGFLFWITGDDIIAGAFVTLSSTFLQTMAGNFAGFFGGGHLGQSQMPRMPEPSEPVSKPAVGKS